LKGLNLKSEVNKLLYLKNKSKETNFALNSEVLISITRSNVFIDRMARPVFILVLFLFTLNA